MSEIVFDELRHEYTVGGIVRPSVTQILKAAGLIEEDWYSVEARDRGKAVHIAAHYADEHDLDISWRETSPYAGYLAAWEKFQTDAGFIPELVEYRVFNRAFGYCGTLDRTGILEAETVTNAVVDLKTGGVEEWHRVQLAAYCAAFERPMRFRRINVYLNPDGTYRVREYAAGSFRADFAVFAAAVAIWNFKNGGHVNGNGNRAAGQPTAA
ncbi:MAG TPA: hypothetical protein VFW83_06100 [Bryobacteraceae bacterium]|nr:hypothetical protein [Bryobacteraceae bacterium]